METMREVILRNGARGWVRPILPTDREALLSALEDLAPESRQRRFLHDKETISEAELERLSHPDGVDHIAFGVGVDLEGEFTPIAVGRCFRDPEDPERAEIALVTADAWQGLGAGEELMRSLSKAAGAVGIRYWVAPMLYENPAMRGLLKKCAIPVSERDLGGGIVEMVCAIR